MINTHRRNYLARTLTVLIGTSVCLWLLIACAPPAISVPPMSQFTQPAIGTPIPTNLSASPVDLPPDSSGVAFYNQKGGLIHVVLSNTNSIVAIPPTSGYLFVLDPGTYDFYVYEGDNGPSAHTETVEPGKVRYVYIYPIVPDPNQ